jgi:CRISPR-associated protein Cmr4
LALHRLKRDLDAVGLASGLQVPEDPKDALLLPQDPTSVLKDSNSNNAYFEDLSFSSRVDSTVKRWAEDVASWIFVQNQKWQEEFKKRFAVIPNDSFDFLCETGTEVNARVRIDQEKKTVEKGALWYEESLPAKTILGGLVWCDEVFPKNSTTKQQLMEKFCTKESQLQIGGKATVGKGRVRCLFSGA